MTTRTTTRRTTLPAAWLLALLAACAQTAPADVAATATVPPVAQDATAETPAAPTVVTDPRRSEILDVARAYAEHEWTASPANALHGPDVDGIHVDTPDASHREDGFLTDGSVNVGVPYKWGGFSSLEDFDAAVAAGQPAGQLTDGVNLDASAHAVGVDCSGYVARAWNLPMKQSTRSLGRLCFELGSYDELLPGDLLNKFDAHAMLFVRFDDEEHTWVRVLEAAFPKVKESSYPRDRLEELGFRAFRYKPLDERWASVERAPVDVRVTPGQGGFQARGEPESFDVDDPPSGVDLASVLDGRFADGLAAAEPGDWVAYRAGNIDGPLALAVQRVVAGTYDGPAVQTTTSLGERSMGTLEQHPAAAPFAGRLLGLEDSGQPLDAMAVVSGVVTPGAWVDGDVELPARRVELVLRGAMTSRSNALPLDVRITAIVSPEVPLEGVVSWDRRTRYELPSGEVESTFRYRLEGFGRAGSGS